jgi:hypothetical protein
VAYVVADTDWDYLSSHATRAEAEAEAAMSDGCHVVEVPDANPGSLAGLSGSPFQDFLESHSG